MVGHPGVELAFFGGAMLRGSRQGRDQAGFGKRGFVQVTEGADADGIARLRNSAVDALEIFLPFFVIPQLLLILESGPSMLVCRDVDAVGQS